MTLEGSFTGAVNEPFFLTPCGEGGEAALHPQHLSPPPSRSPTLGAGTQAGIAWAAAGKEGLGPAAQPPAGSPLRSSGKPQAWEHARENAPFHHQTPTPQEKRVHWEGRACSPAPPVFWIRQPRAFTHHKAGQLTTFLSQRKSQLEKDGARSPPLRPLTPFRLGCSCL